MIKRPFWLATGYALGVGTSAYAVVRLRRTIDRLRPPAIMDRVGGSVEALRAGVADAVLSGREAKQLREAELRSQLVTR